MNPIPNPNPTRLEIPPQNEPTASIHHHRPVPNERIEHSSVSREPIGQTSPQTLPKDPLVQPPADKHELALSLPEI